MISPNKINDIFDDQSYNKFNYKQIHYLKIKGGWYSFAFNADSTILFAGCEKGNIKIYGFNNRHKQIQILKTNEQMMVWNLYFLKKSNELISQTYNGKAFILKLDKNNFWKQGELLEGHYDNFGCIAVNEDEDLLISGSHKEKIKFWKKGSQIWSCFQTINVSQWVMCLSLNPSSTKLLVSGFMEVQIIELQHSQEWIIIQKIQSGKGCRFCFINDNSFLFAFKLKCIDYLEIYTYNQEGKQFNKDKYVQIFTSENNFNFLIMPILYKREKKIMMFQNNYQIHLFGIDQNGQFAKQQSIIYTQNQIFGNLTSDGQYLIYSSKNLEEVIIRKLLVVE